jgi:hypothetical protein
LLECSTRLCSHTYETRPSHLGVDRAQEEQRRQDRCEVHDRNGRLREGAKLSMNLVSASSCSSLGGWRTRRFALRTRCQRLRTRTFSSVSPSPLHPPHPRGLKILAGSTNITTPEEFVHDLSNLDRGGGASLAPRGPSASSTTSRPKHAPAIEPPPPSQLSQGALDRRFAPHTPPVQLAPPSQSSQRPPAASKQVLSKPQQPPPASGKEKESKEGVKKKSLFSRF